MEKGIISYAGAGQGTEHGRALLAADWMDSAKILMSLLQVSLINRLLAQNA